MPIAKGVSYTDFNVFLTPANLCSSFVEHCTLGCRKPHSEF